MILLGDQRSCPAGAGQGAAGLGSGAVLGAVSLAADRGRGAGEALVSRLSPALL